MQTPYSENIKPFVISEPALYRYRAMATRHLKFPIIGQVKDVNGSVWDIRDVRITKHGFDIYYGTPASDHGAYVGGLPRLIATEALYDFWDNNRTRGHGFLFELPAGRTTMKRLRRKLGFNHDDDVDEFWSDRLAELQTMRPRDFAAKHGLRTELVFDWRAKLLGRRARQLGWWRTPETISLLVSNLTLKEVGKKLNIGTSQVHRLRRRAKAEQLAAEPAVR